MDEVWMLCPSPPPPADLDNLANLVAVRRPVEPIHAGQDVAGVIHLTRVFQQHVAAAVDNGQAAVLAGNGEGQLCVINIRQNSAFECHSQTVFGNVKNTPLAAYPPALDCYQVADDKAVVRPTAIAIAAGNRTARSGGRHIDGRCREDLLVDADDGLFTGEFRQGSASAQHENTVVIRIGTLSSQIVINSRNLPGTRLPFT